MAGHITLGLPLVCPKCPAKHYYGVLKGEAVRTTMVKYGKDVCPNCRTHLVLSPPMKAFLIPPDGT